MTNKRYHFELNGEKSLIRKYGSTPDDALFRWQLDLLREQINPSVFRLKKVGKKVDKK